MSQTLMVTLRPETSREDRMFNIANMMNKLKAEGLDGVGKLRLRQEIRKVLGMPTLSGELDLGDRRAHGDAVGGHGLHLECESGEKGEYIPFSKENMAIIAAFLNGLPQKKILW